MAHVYVASYATQDEFLAEIEDPSARDMGLAHFASPQFARVWQHFTIEALDEFADYVRGEVSTEMDGDGADTWHWGPMSHEVPENGRENWTIDLLDEEYGLLATIVVQKVEISA